MDTTTKKLFKDFGPVSKEQWKEQAIADLKGADFEKKLVWQTDNGFSVEPFYTKEDVENISGTELLHKIFSTQKRKWINYIEIDAGNPDDANKKATKALQFGSNGILFKINNPDKVDFQSLLNGLDTETLHLSFRLKTPSHVFVSNYLNYLQSQNIDPGSIKGFIDADTLENWIATGIDPDYEALTQMVSASASAPGLRTLSIHSDAFVNSGGSTTQELAFTLSKLTAYFDQLNEKGIKDQEIADNLVLHMATSGDYFAEIAKIRALRVALQSVLHCFNVNASNVPIISSNAFWSKSLYDPYVNLLRNTTEGMSAILGGCDAILINPHDDSYGNPTDFSHRIALNISNLIEHEAYFDKVIDPAAGSYYIEHLTLNLTEKSLELFKKVEDKGGFTTAFKENFIQNEIKAVRDKKEKESATRKRVFVGTNKYPDLGEKVAFRNDKKEKALEDGMVLLEPQRMTQQFERLRQRTQAHFEKTGKLPKVFLACFGNPAMRTARAMFSAEFFGIAGFDIMVEKVFDSAESAAKESAGSEADIVVICSSDQDYESNAVSFVETFRSTDKKKELILAGYPQIIIEELITAGVDNFIHMKTNAIETLQALQDKFNL